VKISAADINTSLAGSSAAVSKPRAENGPSQKGQTAGENSSISTSELQKVVRQMQHKLDSSNIGLAYKFYGAKENKIAVKVINKDTGDVIREIPPKEMQALQIKMGELVSMIFDGKA